MLRRTVQANQRNYLFSPDNPVPLGARTWAIVKLRVTDELTGGPPDSKVTIQPLEKGLTPRVTSDGIAGLVGIPREIFPALRTTNYTVHLKVSAEGYVSQDLKVDLLSDPSFPDTFTPPPLINLSLHHEPIIISGRTVKVDSSATIPIANATVNVTGIWRKAPAANVVVPSSPPNIVSVLPPLYSNRPPLTQSLVKRKLTPVAGSEKLLLEEVLPGDNPIPLPDRQGVSAGDVLLIDAAEPDLAEFIAIKTVPTTSPVDQPTLITLEYPVLRAHRREAVLQRMNVSPAGTPQQITVEAIPGDTCVFVDGTAGFAGASEVQITGPPGPDEHHKILTFSVTSDADGYYRLAPLSRVAQLEIHAEKIIGPLTFKATTTFRPDYRQRENRLDFVLKV